MTLSITMLYHYAECHYAECRFVFIVMRSVFVLIVVMLAMLSVVMLGVAGPKSLASKLFIAHICTLPWVHFGPPW